MSQHNWSSLYVYYHLKLAARYIAENLVFRDKIEIFSFLISFFETRSRFLLSLSRFSRRDRDFFFPYLGFRDVSRQNLEQNLTRFFEIEISRHALLHCSCTNTCSPELTQMINITVKLDKVGEETMQLYRDYVAKVGTPLWNFFGARAKNLWCQRAYSFCICPICFPWDVLFL